MSFSVDMVPVFRGQIQIMGNLLCLRPVVLFSQDSACSSYRLSLLFKLGYTPNFAFLGILVNLFCFTKHANEAFKNTAFGINILPSSQLKPLINKFFSMFKFSLKANSHNSWSPPTLVNNWLKFSQIVGLITAFLHEFHFWVKRCF